MDNQTQGDKSLDGSGASPLTDLMVPALKVCDMSRPESEHTMSNFDHEIEDGLEADLKAGMRSEYYAVNFFGRLWYEDGHFYCMVKRYHVHVATIKAETLQQIMDSASEMWGAE